MIISVWVFVILGVEAIKAFRANPYFALATHGLFQEPVLIWVQHW